MPDEESYLNESLRKVVKGAGINFSGMVIGAFLGFLSRIILARWLEASDYGLISLGIAALSIASTLAMVGMTTGVTRYVSFYRAKGDEGGIKGTIVSALKISFPISLALAALLCFGSDWISIYIFHAPELSPVLKIFAFALPFLTLATIFLSATLGFEDMRYNAYVGYLLQM
jgi:O-antigen/teichoic acid export membrane protein